MQVNGALQALRRAGASIRDGHGWHMLTEGFTPTQQNKPSGAQVGLRAAVLAYLRQRPTACAPEIAAETGYRRDSIALSLNELCRLGTLTRVSKGVFALAQETTAH